MPRAARQNGPGSAPQPATACKQAKFAGALALDDEQPGWSNLQLDPTCRPPSGGGNRCLAAPSTPPGSARHAAHPPAPAPAVADRADPNGWRWDAAARGDHVGPKQPRTPRKTPPPCSERPITEATQERGSGERAALAQRNAPRGRGHQVRGVPGSGRERNALRPTADPA